MNSKMGSGEQWSMIFGVSQQKQLCLFDVPIVKAAADSDVDATFEKAIAYVKALPEDGPVKLTNEAKLEFYAWFKQATVGTCAEKGGSQPWMTSVTARAKWDAWAALKDMSAEDAKKAYIESLRKYAADFDK